MMDSTRPLQGLAEVSCNLKHLGCELACAYACALACTRRAHADHRNPEKQPSQTCNPTITQGLQRCHACESRNQVINSGSQINGPLLTGCGETILDE